jgi:pimeloyl-ACP methyl ester carboxylesterase
MAHGFGGTRDSGLAPFAERFQAAGADVLVFDYRGFGDSAGNQRQLVDHRRHREDYRAVVAHARTLEGIDPDRVVLWGSSYSGGHVVAVAADDPRIAGVVAQGAAMDGLVATLEIVRYDGPRLLLRLVGHALRGLVAALLRRPPHLIPLIGPPGSVAAMTAPDVLSGYGAITGPTFRNEMQARGILLVSRNRPVTRAERLTMPLLLVIAERDTIAPVSAVERVAREARGPVTVERLDVGHFDIYVGEPFETTVAAEVEFLGSVVGATMSA